MGERDKIFKEFYLFMKDYLKVLKEAFNESIELRNALRKNKIETIENRISKVENLEIKIKILEETRERIFVKLAKALGIRRSEISWELIEKYGGKDISELGKTIEENLKKLIDINLVNKLVIEKLILFNLSMRKIISSNKDEHLYNNQGDITVNESSLLGEV